VALVASGGGRGDVKFAILGPIELYDGQRRLSLGGRPLALLAFFVLHANRAVSSDRLIEALWAGQDPAGARKRVQVAVARLRKALATSGSGKPPLRTVSGG
jgi:DNA-binding SARP family transcriptional activator